MERPGRCTASDRSLIDTSDPQRFAHLTALLISLAIVVGSVGG